MAKKIYTKDELNTWTVDGLRDLCKSYGITGMSKQRKDNIIAAILASYKSSDTAESSATSLTKTVDSRPIINMVAVMSMNAKDPSSRTSKMDTTIHVSCGASSGNFSVVGKPVAEVASKLKDVLNIDRISVGVVNGHEVSDSYVLKDGDNLEFIKPAGAKGLF